MLLQRELVEGVAEAPEAPEAPEVPEAPEEGGGANRPVLILLANFLVGT